MADTTQSTPPATSGAGAGIDREILVLGLVIVAGTIMAVLDTTIVNVALDTLGRDLNAQLSTVQWVVTGYLLALGTVIPVTGWAIDRFGGKRVWMLSILLFAGGSALCGFSWNIGSLIAFRALQGLGGGMLMPAGQTILTRAAGPERIGRVFSIIGVPMLLGPVVGPVLGGWLVQDTDWRWIFFVNLPVGALALALAAWKMPALDEARGSGTLDIRGLLLLPPGFVLLIYGLSTASSGGFGQASTIAWLTGGVVLVALFVLHSLQRRERALIDVRLFANKVFAAASFGAFLIGCALFGSLLLLPLYYQVARGEGALNAGLLLAPQGLGAAVMMPVAGLLTDKLGAGRVVPVGIVLGLLGTIAFTQVHADTSYWLLGGSLFVRGLGLGATMMPTMSAAFATLTRQAVARATSAMNIIMQLGGSFGGALLAVFLSRAISSKLPPGAHATGSHLNQITPAIREKIAPILSSAFGQTFWIAFGMMAAIIIPALFLPRRGTAAPSDPAPAH